MDSFGHHISLTYLKNGYRHSTCFDKFVSIVFALCIIGITGVHVLDFIEQKHYEDEKIWNPIAKMIGEIGGSIYFLKIIFQFLTKKIVYLNFTVSLIENLFKIKDEIKK